MVIEAIVNIVKYVVGDIVPVVFQELLFRMARHSLDWTDLHYFILLLKQLIVPKGCAVLL